MNVEQASAVLMDLVAIRERHGEGFAQARRTVFNDQRFAHYVRAHEGETATDGEREAIRKGAAETERRAAGGSPYDGMTSDQIEDEILTRAEKIVAARGGDLADAVRDALSADRALAEAYKGLFDYPLFSSSIMLGISDG